MKMIRSMSLTSLILCTSIAVHAADVKCPPTEMIKHTVFTSAVMKGSNQWSLTSHPFIYKGVRFNANLYLDGVIKTNNENVALIEGQRFFNQATLMNRPYQTNPDPGGIQYIHCKYWEGENGYYVEATTPPYPY